jgi:hypothetical protein
VQHAVPENEIAKIFVCSPQNSIGLKASTEDCLVVDSGFRLSDIQNIVAIRAKPINNFFVDIFVRDDLHART